MPKPNNGMYPRPYTSPKSRLGEDALGPSDVVRPSTLDHHLEHDPLADLRDADLLPAKTVLRFAFLNADAARASPSRTRFTRSEPGDVTVHRHRSIRVARVCLDCDEVHDAQTCPICASESFAYVLPTLTRAGTANPVSTTSEVGRRGDVQATRQSATGKLSRVQGCEGCHRSRHHYSRWLALATKCYS